MSKEKPGEMPYTWEEHCRLTLLPIIKMYYPNTSEDDLSISSSENRLLLDVVLKND